MTAGLLGRLHVRLSWAGSSRRVAVAVLAGIVAMVLWELYKLVGPQGGGHLFGASVLPRAEDRSMPHVWDVASRMLAPESSADGSPSVALALLEACWFTLRVSGQGWFAGVVAGFGLAVLMQRFRLAESAVLPWVVLSQTVPLIAFAPLVVGWGGKIHFGAFAWDRPMSVALIASYLAFFPVAVGALRGLQSPEQAHVELFRAQAASWWGTFRSLRLPASVPYVIPALRLGAASAVVGAIVAEVSTGTDGGIGRLIIAYAQAASGDPAKPWAAIVGAAVLGLVASGLVSLLSLGLGRYRHLEVS